MIWRLAALLVCLCTPALATVDGFPALYDVAGVEANDVLNIRRAPSAATEIIGTLAPDATGIEVIETNRSGTWGRVNLPETSGWVSLAFLERRPGQWAGRPLQSAQCFGTEPFWSLGIAPDEATFDTPDALALDFAFTNRFRSRNRIDRHTSLFENDLGGLVATFANMACTDGMSDRRYGWHIDILLVVAGEDNAQMFSGCCAIQP